MSAEKREPLTQDELKSILEALLFVSGDPVPLKRLAEVVELEPEVVGQALAEMSEAREKDPRGGVVLLDVAGGYQLRTLSAIAPYVHRFLERKRMVTLTGAALETLAIVAYRQPLIRAEIEAIRGVSVDGILRSLLDKRLLRVAGVGDGPGKPNLYGTTKAFLEQFGLRSLSDLPPVEDLEGTFSSRAELSAPAEDIEVPGSDTENSETAETAENAEVTPENSATEEAASSE